MKTKEEFEQLLQSTEKNRKKKKYFPEHWLIRNYKETAAYDLAYKFFTDTVSDEEIEMTQICTKFDKRFFIIRGYSIEEAIEMVFSIQSSNSKKRHEKYSKEESKKFSNTCIEYYLNKGMTLEQAQIALSERQATFSLQKCIEKYGKQDGYNVWESRQIKWQKTLKEKPKEEILEINRKKNVFDLDNCIRIYGEDEGKIIYEKNMLRASLLSSSSRSSKSIVSKIFFDWLFNRLYTVYNLSTDALYWDNEKYLKRDNQKIYFYDCCIESYKIIIEYHGISYHSKENDVNWISVNGISYTDSRMKDIDKRNIAEKHGYTVFEIYSDATLEEQIIFSDVVYNYIKDLNEKNNY